MKFSEFVLYWSFFIRSTGFIFMGTLLHDCWLLIWTQLASNHSQAYVLNELIEVDRAKVHADLEQFKSARVEYFITY